MNRVKGYMLSIVYFLNCVKSKKMGSRRWFGPAPLQTRSITRKLTKVKKLILSIVDFFRAVKILFFFRCLVERIPR